jgi:hypothetical protein
VTGSKISTVLTCGAPGKFELAQTRSPPNKAQELICGKRDLSPVHSARFSPVFLSSRTMLKLLTAYRSFGPTATPCVAVLA